MIFYHLPTFSTSKKKNNNFLAFVFVENSILFLAVFCLLTIFCRLFSAMWEGSVFGCALVCAFDSVIVCAFDCAIVCAFYFNTTTRGPKLLTLMSKYWPYFGLFIGR